MRNIYLIKNMSFKSEGLSMLDLRSYFDSSNRDEVARRSYLIGFFIVSYIFFQILISSISLLMGKEINSFHFCLAFLSWALASFCVVQFMKQKPARYFFCFFVSVLIIVSSILFSSLFYDISYDGQAYHQEAIIRLSTGWNPYYENLDSKVLHWLWINHYPKASWIYGANLFKFTNQIECGKSVNILLIITSFFFFVTVFASFKKLTLRSLLFLSALLAMNPVSLQQSLTFYVDGAFGSLIACLLASMFFIYQFRRRVDLLLFLMSGVILINLKFTSIPYLLIISGAFIVTIFLWRREQLYTCLLTLILTLVVGVGIVGYTPYVRNIIHEQHIFYPVMGKSPVDIMTYNTPESIRGKSTGEKFFKSLLSPTDNNIKNGLGEMKAPFSFKHFNEFKASIDHDVRLAGMGVFYSGIFIISILGTIYLFFASKKTATTYAFGLILSGLVVSIAINPESWWARYVPQLWTLVIILLTIFIAEKTKILRLIGVGCIFLGFLNSGSILGGILAKNVYATRAVNQQLNELSSHAKSIEIYYGNFYSNRLRYFGNGVAATELTSPGELSCSESDRVRTAFSVALYCIK